jgi:alpha-L-glutamate ligase-like protein
MAISSLPLGLNSRNFTYIRKYNYKRSKRRADSKIRSKKNFINNQVPTISILKIFRTRKDIKNFDWGLPEKGFVIKPSRGYGGEGILLFKSWDGEKAKTSSGLIYDKQMISSHIFDILEGIFSLQHLSDVAFIEERVIASPFFKKLSPLGLPDIRIVVFKKIPTMAMIRIPTKESEGKASLHLGAIGLGIGIRTGITFRGIYKNEKIFYLPDTKIKTRGIKIPYWDEILKIAVKAQSVSGLGYAGVDIVVDKEKGPLVLEINSRPGLSIQLVNNASLRTRLERVEDIEVPNMERGIEIAKNLFAQSDYSKLEASSSVLSVIENVTFNARDGSGVVTIPAKLDTGAFRTSIDENLVKELGYPILSRKIMVKSASGIGFRSTAKIKFKLKGKQISSIASVVDRSALQYKMIVGRKDLKGYLIDPEIANEEEDVFVEDVIETN